MRLDEADLVRVTSGTWWWILRDLDHEMGVEAWLRKAGWRLHSRRTWRRGEAVIRTWWRGPGPSAPITGWGGFDGDERASLLEARCG